MKKVFAVLILLGILTGCATRITQPSASAEDLATVTSFMLEQNEARVHFYLGNAHFQGNTAQMNEAAELFISIM